VILKALREEAGLTQAELARRIHTDPAYLSRAEAGNATPSRTFLERAMAATGFNVTACVDANRPRGRSRADVAAPK
jgi:transcriptional regulator with XRE-family HTH domain